MKRLLFLLSSALAASPVILPAADVPQAPPPAVTGQRIIAPVATRPGLHAEAPYSIGEPTDEEQLYLEFINRARANPTVEGALLAAVADPQVTRAYDFFDVDLGLMQAESAQYPPAPPLAFHARLIDAARAHSQDMFGNMFQGHDGSDGSDAGDRITAAGYVWASYGENVYSYAESVLHGHAGFFVDWGNGPGGMQQPRGHRDSIMNPGFREAGVGVVLGTNGNVGPQLVTQEFASAAGAKPYITGVVYYDLNTNGTYDLGEGLGGVAVTAAGVAGSAVSAGSGGYALPITGNGGHTVHFAVAGGSPASRPATVAANQNAKLDLSLPYPPPAVTGPASAETGRDTLFATTPVPGATGYAWRANRRVPFAIVYGAEGGLAGLVAAVSPGYPVVTNVRSAGTSGYHLAHPEPQSQTLAVPVRLRPGPTAALYFSSRLGWASTTQRAVVEVSTDDGATWSEAWSQAGTGTAGETVFRPVTVGLADFSGRLIRLRLAYVLGPGSYYGQTSAGRGWHLDEIRFENVEDGSEELTGTAAADGMIRFHPPAPGQYALSARATTGARLWPWGPALGVAVVEGGTQPEFASIRIEDTGRVVLAVKPRPAGAPALRVQAAPTPAGGWTDTGLTVPAAGGEVSLPGPALPTRFFRLAGTP
ncbi:MAG: CAP domain-containing protein [Limisphaerales bacterium]